MGSRSNVLVRSIEAMWGPLHISHASSCAPSQTLRAALAVPERLITWPRRTRRIRATECGENDIGRSLPRSVIHFVERKEAHENGLENQPGIVNAPAFEHARGRHIGRGSVALFLGDRDRLRICSACRGSVPPSRPSACRHSVEHVTKAAARPAGGRVARRAAALGAWLSFAPHRRLNVGRE